MGLSGWTVSGLVFNELGRFLNRLLSGHGSEHKKNCQVLTASVIPSQVFSNLYW